MEKYKFQILLALNVALLLLVILLLLERRSYRDQGVSYKNESEQLLLKDERGESAYHRHEVKNTIIKNMPALASCYDKFIAQNPTKKDGVIKVDWQILPSGKVKNPQVVTSELTTEKGGKELAECTIKEIEKWLFPEPPSEKPVYVWHNFYFGRPIPRGAPQIVNVK